MRDAAQVAMLKEHDLLFSDARAVLADLPPDNHYVHQALSEALQHCAKQIRQCWPAQSNNRWWHQKSFWLHLHGLG